MKSYKNLFFDLDDTLWDFKRNTFLTLKDIITSLELEGVSENFEGFMNIYHRINEGLWAKYRKGEIDKETLRWYRFYLSLCEMGIDNRNLAKKLDREYIEQTPFQTTLLPHARETLDYLSGRHYRMFIITNGFNEVQFTKLRQSGLEPYFQKMITSEMAGKQKPHPGFFEYALRETASLAGESLVIGDNPETDIEGGRQAGMETVYFCPGNCQKEVSAGFLIRELSELKSFL